MADVIVLGAGMVGVSSALALQARGRSVLLVDRREPGRETSYGNAGIIQAEAVEPYAMPRDLATLFQIALNRDNSVRYSLRALPGVAGSLARYFWHSAPSRHQAISAAYSKLVERATTDHAPLVAAAGADNQIKREGFRQAYRSEAALDAAWTEAERLDRDYGVRARRLGGAELATAEPVLERPLAGAVHWMDSWTCSDPGGLVTAYAELFERRGGTITTGDALSLRSEGKGWRIETRDGPVSARNVVVALGPWSPDLLRRFGYRIHMVKKRGYHAHYACEPTLNLPMMDVASGVVLSPMRTGLRIATGAELTAMGAPSAPRQLAVAEAAVRELLPLGKRVEDTPWHGTRPCLPDMLPLVGEAPRHPGLWMNFGHGHQGFTLGPTTAALLADAMDGAEDPLARMLAPTRLKAI
ncbi:FAD-binding oxidoreductase [Aurantimonas sp. VKM B-3413]|uniref:NAD(P)/FAD-dependent oxidoreductase n=1 Tax=Aurantimonas sp. VKM B-3413 TaxID=2779401 RepID=UPI001E312D75|nr:FAD-dependent oxidoreductase [Aurantimonas sp. VKM B-3413]MCB8840336.1 FAD-binding oxidoreductase [Aurantimonas sp. VKM B-3413]